MRWGTVPGEFDKMPATLVVDGKASRPAELVTADREFVDIVDQAGDNSCVSDLLAPQT
jgi:hypothetical protein